MAGVATVTILFTDVVGNTALRQRLGDAAAERVLETHNSLIREQIRLNDGREVKTIGDAFMVAFASARKAIDCAVAIQRALSEYNQRNPGKEIEVRIGINTGEATEEAGDFSGTAVNAAKYIQDKAGGGQILVSETVRALVGPVQELEFVDHGRVSLKGMSNRWRLFEVPWVAPEPAVESPLGGRTPFVGRQEERATLSRLLDEARSGHGSLVFVSGEAGIGKTRLAEELIDEARARGMFTAIGRCYEMEGAPPYAPFLEVIDYAARVVPRENLLDSLGEGAPEVAKLAPRLRRIVSSLGEPLELAPEQARYLMFESVCDFFERGARTQPILFLFDDLHWADESTCRLLEHLAHRLRDMAVFAVGTYREPEVDPGTPLARSIENLGRQRLAHRVSLRRFGEGELRAMLRLLAGREVPDALAEVIYFETEGVPYFVEELFRHLQEEGRLFDASGDWRPGVQLGEVEVPETVRLVLGRRLERVSEQTVRSLAHAAAVGRDFTYEFLRALVDTDDEGWLLDCLEEAEAANLIRSTGGSSPRYSFWHEQIRQAVLGNISFPRRQQLHARVARTIESLYADELDEHLDDLAHHLSLAGQTEPAVDYLIRAAQQNAARYANAEALEYYRRALDLDQRGRQRRRVLVLRAKLLLGLFRGREAASDLEELLDLCRQEGDRQAEVEVLLDLGSAYWTMALDAPEFLAKSREALEEAYTLAQPLGDRSSMARALLPTIWFSSFLPGYGQQVRENIREAVALSEEVGDEMLLLDARRARMHILPGDEAAAEGEALREQLEARRSFVRLNDVLFDLMWLHYHRGNFQRCVDVCEEGKRVARRIGAEPVQYASIKGLALLELGRFDEAWDAFQDEIADEEHPFGQAQQQLGIAAYYAAVMAHAEAEAAARHAIELARQLGRPWIERWAQDILARSLVALGEVTAPTAAEFREACSALGARPSTVAVAEALVEAGQTGEALAELRDLVDAPEGFAKARWIPGRPSGLAIRSWLEAGVPRDHVAALEIVARALLAAGRPEDAVQVLEAGSSMARDMSFTRLLWRFEHSLGAAREALGERGVAAKHYAEAAMLLRAMADTIPEPALREGFLSSGPATAVMEAANGDQD